MKTSKRQCGISLLEILLVVIIAAVIISGAVNYYSQTSISSHVSQATNLIEQINKAGYEWRQIANSEGVYPADFSGLNGGAGGNGLWLLTQDELIPCENQSCFHNPWGAKR